MKRHEFLLIGQAPGPTGPPPGRPLVGGRSGTFLQNLTGLSLKHYLWRCETRNLLSAYPGRTPDGKGDRFPVREARAAADAMAPSLKGRRVIFVGAAVMAAFGHNKWLPAFEWHVERHDPVDHAMIEPLYDWAWLPHPSPVNRFWNAPENVELARSFFHASLSGDKDANPKRMVLQGQAGS